MVYYPDKIIKKGSLYTFSDYKTHFANAKQEKAMVIVI